MRGCVRACIKKRSGTSVPVSLHPSEYVRVRPIPCTSVPVRTLPFMYGSFRACACVLGHIIVNTDASMGHIVRSPDASSVLRDVLYLALSLSPSPSSTGNFAYKDGSVRPH